MVFSRTTRSLWHSKVKLDSAVTKHILRLQHKTKVAMLNAIPSHLKNCLKFNFLTRTTQDEAGNTINYPIFVHSKVMIVDKVVCVIGSANINDRSILAYRDTEMAAVIHSREVASKLEEDLRRQHAAFLKEFLTDLTFDLSGGERSTSISGLDLYVALFG
ncbi:Hypothetical protein, putative [Bodo saltans]|uniref:phospholipase D n=1 Tax=Bodo saltans TaxID=75058 RepID=A0A0S4IUA1_BODSA|nr:Hypothetical protein, putative [Bodo saltans]|eukprot:CUF90132.1 Hypothetical protein, putative [Bodo saltans]